MNEAIKKMMAEAAEREMSAVIALYECTTREQQEEYECCATSEAIEAIEMSGGGADPTDRHDEGHIADICEDLGGAPEGMSEEEFEDAITSLIHSAIKRTEVKYDQTGADEFFNTVRNKANESL